VEEVGNMDRLADTQGSPTADYALLASDDLANEIKRAKSAFDDMERRMMRDAVQRANPWELVSTRGHHIFQNRAAMKMAEMDWLFNLTHRSFGNKEHNGNTHLHPQPTHPASTDTLTSRQ
jgi:hypothetical protein